MENTLLQRLTKEDLITVIAKLSDGEDWRYCGYSLEDGEKLQLIAQACTRYCDKTKTWKIRDFEND